MTQRECQDSKRQSAQKRSRLMTLLAGAMLMTSACGSIQMRPEYEPLLPTFKTMIPMVGMCSLQGAKEAECILMAREDFDALVREAKAMCLALGHSETACQVSPNADH